MRTSTKIITAATIVALAAVIPTSVHAATNYFDETRIVSGNGSAGCPTGYKVVSGGVTVPANSYSSSQSTEYFVLQSIPGSSTSWTTKVLKVTGYYYSSTGRWSYQTTYPNMPVKAVCIR